MRKFRISEILQLVEEAPDNELKVEILRSHDSIPLRQILQWTFDSRIKWLLPEGDVPYKPSPFTEVDGALYSEVRRLYLFVEGGNDSLKPLRREQLFIQLLESLHPDDARLLTFVKDKQLPYKSITPKLVNEAFPGTIEMSKSYKRRKDDYDDMEYEVKKKVTADRRKTKRIKQKIKTKAIDDDVEDKEYR